MVRDKLTAQEVIKLVSNVVGEIEPDEYCDHDENSKRYENLCIMIRLTDWCIDNIIRATWGVSCEISEQRINDEADKALEVWYKTLQKEVEANAVY